MQPISVVLADDHAIVRKGRREFLEEDEAIAVVAEASNRQEACRLIGELRPDLAVLDIQMPVMTGIEATRQIKAAHLILRLSRPMPRQAARLSLQAPGWRTQPFF